MKKIVRLDYFMLPHHLPLFYASRGNGYSAPLACAQTDVSRVR